MSRQRARLRLRPDYVWLRARMDENAEHLSDAELRALISRLVRRETKAMLHQIRVMVPVLGFGVTLVGVTSVGRPGSVDFYKSAATVIPTLLLTLAVQGRFFRLADIANSPLYQELRRKEITRDSVKRLGASSWVAWVLILGARLWLAQSSRNTRLYTFVVLLAIATGEVCALYAVAGGTRSPVLLGTVSAAMAAAFLGIAQIALGGVQADTSRDTSEAEMQGWRHVIAELARRKQEREQATVIGPRAGGGG
jgi:hypothetical protein